MKKLLSVLMSICLLISIVPAAAVASAEEIAETAEISLFDGGMYVLEPTATEISADLSDKYADSIGYNDTLTEPTLLDAAIALSITVYGEDFQSVAPMKISKSGWITSAFGAGMNISYRQNGNAPTTLDTALSANDYVEFLVYSDTVGWSDKYSSFDKRSAQTYVGQSLSLTAYVEGYDSSWNVVNSPAAGYAVTVDGTEAGKTDENGVATVKFDKAGTYVVSLEPASSTEYIFAPYCKVTVTENPLAAEIQGKIDGGMGFIVNDKTTVSVSSAGDFLTYLKSGADMSKYSDKFVAEVDALLADGGKLTTDQTQSNALAIYASTIGCLEELGYDPANYNGCNLVEQFEALEPDAISNPYYYRIAIEYASESFAKKLIDQMIKDYYVMGSGMNWYGFSADNTAFFLTAIASYKDSYQEVVTDALKLLSTYTNDDGMFYNTKYNSTSPDSTATAIMAYAALGETDRADALYNNLIDGFEGESNGVIQYNGADNAYATKEAVLAFEYLIDNVRAEGYDHILKLNDSTFKACTGGTRTYSCTKDGCDKTVSFDFEATAQHIYVVTQTTKSTCISEGKIVYSCSVCGDTNTAVVPIDENAHDFGDNLEKCSLCGAANPNYVAPTTTTTTTTTTASTAANASTTAATTATASASTTASVAAAAEPSSTSKLYDKRGSYLDNSQKKASIKKLTKGKKQFKASWKKVSGVKGYQIQYSTSKKFNKHATYVTIKGNKNTSKTIKGLSKNKKYYVRICTYTTKKINGKTVKVYSPWSKTKTVKTK